MLKVSYTHKHGGVTMKTGEFYTFQYQGFERDPAPHIIFINKVEGIHPKTKHEHRYIQAINVNYLPREERKRFRALIRKYKKQGETDKLKASLEQYYNLAVLVTICYGDHDCNSGVSGWQYDDAVKIVPKLCNEIDFSFVRNGFLDKSNFISKNDWKTFVVVFGKSTKSFNPAMKFKKDI